MGFHHFPAHLKTTEIVSNPRFGALKLAILLATLANWGFEEKVGLLGARLVRLIFLASVGGICNDNIYPLVF
jgi:hypothetical protein